MALSDFAQLPGTTEWIPLESVPGIKSAPPPPLAVLPAPPSPQPTVTGNALQEQPPPAGVRLGPVLRDVAIIFVLTAIGGVIGRLANIGHAPDETQEMMGVAASNFLLGTVGFTISGCLATGNRWRHLACVALGAWALSIFNVVLFGFSVEQWLLSLFFMALIMGIGGGLSFVFKR